MASPFMFGGTTQKCQVCDKTVYCVEQLNADNKVYHKACFRCQHCKGTLKLSNYSYLDGLVYCKPHYDQLLKTTGRLGKSFEGTPQSGKQERSYVPPANNKFSSLFVGTQEKCSVCSKRVYPVEKVLVDGSSYHKICFRCNHGGCIISPSNFVAHEGKIYCKHHHTQLFMTKGNFSKLGHNPEEIKVPAEKVFIEVVKVDDPLDNAKAA